MLIAALETSSPVLSIAVKKDKSPVMEKTVSGFMAHAENLMPELDRLLKKARAKASDVTTWLVGRGPGSFTGLRIGFATLKGFQAVQKTDTFGALSLDLIAENADLPEKSRLAVTLDAFRDKVYMRFYERKNAKWVPSGEAETMEASIAAKKIPQDAWVTGSALEKYAKVFAVPEKKILAQKTWYPKASSLIRLFEAKDLKVKPLSQPEDWIPLYFRLSEAEERMKNVCHA